MPGQNASCWAALSTAALLAATGCAGKAARHGHGRSAVAGYASDTGMAPRAVLTSSPEFNTEAYDRIVENAFRSVIDNPLSTFSIDVDTAAYSNTRRFLHDGQLPPRDAVRIEELINYFSYEYPEPEANQPFSIVAEVAPAPWNPAHKLVHIGLQGQRMAAAELPPRNLVFLLDVSGSMRSPNKLPLIKSAFSLLAETLSGRDHVSIVVYAGASGMVLPPTPGNHANDIIAALHRLDAGGSTNGGQGIRLAYALARRHFDKNAINRVILATDGDFNVGTTDRGSLERLIEDERKTGVYLTVLGFGSGNLKDSTMEQLADKGNGNYAYIDSIAEARKVLVREAGATLVTIAKDVKIQVEFNPNEVAQYRLIGYENRLLADQDFNDDEKDAGEIGAGHSVTALYEIAPGKAAPANAKVDPLEYQGERKPVAAPPGELMKVKLRYKEPDADTSKKISFPVAASDAALADSSEDFRFSAAVAGFGMLLRGSEHRGALTFVQIADLAKSALGKDDHGYRKEFLDLVERAARLSPQGPTNTIVKP